MRITSFIQNGYNLAFAKEIRFYLTGKNLANFEHLFSINVDGLIFYRSRKSTVSYILETPEVVCLTIAAINTTESCKCVPYLETKRANGYFNPKKEIEELKHLKQFGVSLASIRVEHHRLKFTHSRCKATQRLKLTTLN